ncbi:outer membrane usher protein FimD, truncation [Escherichia coli]|uniref:Outer membrane usher protein FimD, truncation n=1 Tax=Escherichia coli TaxID=562 RepID=A0A376U1D0_ECOLX|nr:outer membrane usher protein FimD, truncation [Escherichia coli]
MTNLVGVYGTLLEDNNLSYSVQTGYAGGGDGNSGSTGYATLNYRGGYGNANIGYSHSDDIKQLYYRSQRWGTGSCQWRNAGAAVKRYGGAC